MGRLHKWIWICLLAAFLFALPAAADGNFQTDLDGIDNAAKSVLMLAVFNDKDELIASGSGFVAFDNRTLVTNHHVIEDADSILAESDTGEYYLISKVIAADEKSDIALLEFFSPTDLTPLTLYTGGVLRRAEPVVAIGSPQGLTNTVSLGNISALHVDEGVSYIQFTAPISHGSSGGALFNSRGEVIGITTMIYKDSQNINFAVNIAEVLKLKEANWENKRLSFSQFFSGGYAKATPKSTPRATPKPTQKPGPGATPPPPSGWAGNVRVVASGSGVFVKWDMIPNVRLYYIYRAESKEGEYTLIGTSEQTTFYDRDRKDGVTYHYMVGVEEADSAVRPTSPPGKSPTPAPGSKPPYPGRVKASWTDKGVLITWKAVEGAQEYAIHRSRMPNTGFWQIGTSTTAEYLDAKVDQQVYYYKVTCTRDGLKSAMPSSTISAMPHFEIDEDLTVPRNVKVKTSRQGATITWSAVKGAEKYIIYRTTQKSFGYIALTIVDTNKYEDASPILGLTFYYTVRTVVGDNMSNPSAAVTAKMPGATPSPRPTKTPKPTPTPYIDKDYFVRVGNQADWNKKDGYWRVNPKIVNGSEKTTVVAFTLTYFCQDIYGDPIESEVTGDIFLEVEFEKTIKPRGSLTPGFTLLDGYDGVKYIGIAVTKYRTKDGRTIEVPEEEWTALVRYIELK